MRQLLRVLALFAVPPLANGDPKVAEVLALYDHGILAKYGTHEAVLEVISSGYGKLDANLAMSEVPDLTFRIVHCAPVEYDTAGHTLGQLAHLLKGRDDGAMDHVHELRDAVGADFVSLFVDVASGSHVGFAQDAFAVFRTPGIVPHETAHGMDIAHPDTHPARCGQAYIANGAETYQTIVGSGGPHITVPFFSNPDIRWIDSAGTLLPLGLECAGMLPYADAADVMLTGASDYVAKRPSTSVVTDTTRVISVQPGTIAADCEGASLSRDGRQVAFSTAAALVPADTNGLEDVYVRDLGTQTLTLISITGFAGGVANGASSRPAISHDGRYVAFASEASNLVVGDGNGVADVFLVDRDPDGDGVFDSPVVGAPMRVSTTWVGEANGPSGAPSISADGARIAFVSDATNLVPNDTNGLRDVFVADLGFAAVIRASESAAQATAPSDAPCLSDDGAYVAFSSAARELVPTDVVQHGSAPRNVFTRALGDTAPTFGTGAVEVHSFRLVGLTRHEPDGDSDHPSLSADGRFVAFDSRATDLVRGDTDAVRDVFWFDRDADGNGQFDVISPFGEAVDLRLASVLGQLPTEDPAFVDYANAPADNGRWLTTARVPCRAPAISSDGRFVVFHSASNRLAQGDTNLADDVFLRWIAGEQTRRVSVTSQGGESLPPWTGESHDASISADGRSIAFASAATNLDIADQNAARDVFVHTIDPERNDAAIASVAVPVGTPLLVLPEGLTTSDDIDGVVVASSPVGAKHRTVVVATFEAPDVAAATELRVILDGTVADSGLAAPDPHGVELQVRDHAAGAWVSLSIGDAHAQWDEDVAHGSVALSAGTFVHPVANTIRVRVIHEAPSPLTGAFTTELDWLRVRVQ